MAEYNIVILGSSEVGKTAIIQKYVSNELPEAHSPTAHTVFSKEVTVDSKHVKLTMHDLGADPPAEISKDDFIKKADGFIIAYDITKSDTFNAAKDIQKHIASLTEGKHIPVVLIGTKMDLEDMRDVQLDAAMEFAKEMKLMLFETSAMAGTNVEEAFQKLVALILEMHPAKAQPSSTKMPDKPKKKCCTVQ